MTEEAGKTGGRDPAGFAQFMRADLERSEKLLRAANFHPQ
jgi:hypothetical protein